MKRLAGMVRISERIIQQVASFVGPHCGPFIARHGDWSAMRTLQNARTNYPLVLQPPLPLQEFLPLQPLSPVLQPPTPLQSFLPLQSCLGFGRIGEAADTEPWRQHRPQCGWQRCSKCSKQPAMPGRRPWHATRRRREGPPWRRRPTTIWNWSSWDPFHFTLLPRLEHPDEGGGAIGLQMQIRVNF